jgi:hypothetical protein
MLVSSQLQFDDPMIESLLEIISVLVVAAIIYFVSTVLF